MGAKTIPRNKDPPTQIDAQVKCAQKTKTSANAITKQRLTLILLFVLS
jgi:hypothetical protein